MATKIFIDQGHNPGDINGGAEGSGYREQDITYAVGIYLRDILLEDGRFEARTSRNSPDEILGISNATSLAARVRAANEWGADYFVSIHCNANENPAVNGSEVYVYRLESVAGALAENVLTEMVAQVGTKNNGVRVNPQLYVLRRTQMPAILVELAYISNAADVQKLVNDQYAFAYGIYLGICRYLGLEPTVGTATA